MHGRSEMGDASWNLSRTCVVPWAFSQLFRCHMATKRCCHFLSQLFPIDKPRGLLKRGYHASFASELCAGFTLDAGHGGHTHTSHMMGAPLLSKYLAERCEEQLCELPRMSFRHCSIQCWEVAHHPAPMNLIFRQWMVP